jgi:UDP-N-acetylglucosamine 2-epimerase (non-hydrolysing)
MDHGASVNAIARRVLKRVEEQIAEHRPDALVIQGDTTSAFAASLAAFLEDVPVIHLEAGLRTGNRRSPFPEEANRQLTSVVTDLHLAPTSVARANLEAEGVDAATIVVTGNTVVDALQWAVAQPVTFADPLVVTTHRREAWGDRMLAAMRGLGEVARNHPELDLLLPMHRNPIVRDTVIEALGHLPNVHLTEPLSYAEFCHVMKRSRVIVTDSGGIQEEAPSLGKPVLVLRDTTERPEGVDAGTVKVVGTDQATVTRETERLLTDPEAYAAMANAVNPYGDGHAAERAVQAIEALLVGGERPEEFRP